MNDDDNDLIERLRAWRVEGPPADLAARIVAEASARPQRRAPGQRLAVALERLLTEWRYGLAAKAGALAVCVIVGFAVGELGGGATEGELNVVAIALGQQGPWEAEP